MPCQAIFFEHQLDAKKNSPDLSGPTSIEHQLGKDIPRKTGLFTRSVQLVSAPKRRYLDPKVGDLRLLTPCINILKISPLCVNIFRICFGVICSFGPVGPNSANKKSSNRLWFEDIIVLHCLSKSNFFAF